MLKLQFASIMVDDQEKALRFYTEILGLSKMADIPMGEQRWLTLTNEEEPGKIEVVLEPMDFEPAKIFQKAMYEAGIPATAIVTDDLNYEYQRLKSLGVHFINEPQDYGVILSAIFDDTCGNLINLVQSQFNATQSLDES